MGRQGGRQESRQGEDSNGHQSGPLNFTKEVATSLAHPLAGKIRVRDTGVPELVLRITPTAKAWVVYTKHRGRLIEEPLGRFPSVSVAEARRLAREVVHRLETGNEDPQLDRLIAEVVAHVVETVSADGDSQAMHGAIESAARSATSSAFAPWRAKERPSEIIADTRKRALVWADQAARTAAAQARAEEESSRNRTLRNLFEDWHTKICKPHHKSEKLIRYQWSRYLDQRLGSRQVETIRTEDIRAMHLGIGAENGHTIANRCRSLVSTLYTYGAESDASLANPCSKVAPYKEVSRERFMDAGEIRRFLRSIDHEDDPTARDWFKVSLLVGQRKRNTCAMRWEDVHLDRGLWTLPAETTKNGQVMMAILPLPVVEILTARRASIPHACPWVFPSEKSRLGHYIEPARAWDRIKARANLIGLLDLITAAGHSVPTISEVLQHTEAERGRAVRTHKALFEKALDAAMTHWRQVATTHGLNPDDVEMGDLRIHDLRRSFGSWMTMNGTGQAIVGKALGHRDRRSTEVYARMNLDPVRQAVEETAAAIMGTNLPPV